MNSVNNFLVKTDCFCDYVPLVSSVTNFVDLFQKCVVLPLMDKSKIASSYYYKHLDQKSFLLCFLLVIPVIGNIIVGIYDFSKKKHDDNVVDDHVKDVRVNDPIEVPKIETHSISLDNVERIDVDGSCAQSWPCQHQASVTLKDGRKAFGLNSYNICSIVSNVSEERINPAVSEKWNAKAVKKHFSDYSVPKRGWEPKSPEEVLYILFSRK
jgi:hypothetical protein